MSRSILTRVLLLLLWSIAYAKGAESPIPQAVLTYSGQLTALPTQVKGDRFYLSIPATHNPQLTTAVDHGVSASGEMTRYSFPLPAGAEARVHHGNGQIEISFVSPDAATVAALAPAPSSVAPMPTVVNRMNVPAVEAAAPMTPLPPVAQGPATTPSAPETGFTPSVEAIRNESISLANIDMAVPESPAFAVLGVSPETVTRPTSPRDFATSLLNGVDKNGNFQTGLALDTAPFLLFAGNDVTLEEYQNDYTTRFLSRSQFSFATSKGTNDKDPSTRLALGLHLTFFDNGDPRLDEELLQDFSAALHNAGGMEPIGFGPEADQQIAAINSKFADGVQAAHARRKAERRNWNASSWSLGAAPSWINEDGESGNFQWNGAAVWTSLAYGFENVEVLKDKAQFIAHARYRSREQVPDPQAEGSFLNQDSLLLAARLRVGAPDFNCALDAAWVHESLEGGEDDSAYRLVFSVERRMAKNVWFSLSFGKEFDHQNNENPTLVMAGLKLGYSQEPVLSSQRPASSPAFVPGSIFRPSSPSTEGFSDGKTETVPPSIEPDGSKPPPSERAIIMPDGSKPPKSERAIIMPNGSKPPKSERAIIMPNGSKPPKSQGPIKMPKKTKASHQ